MSEEDLKEEKEENNDDKNLTVVVTGASGFIGSNIVLSLLNKGYNVIGTVRGKPDAEKYKWILKLDKSGKKLSLEQANLLELGSFDKIIAKADYVMHVASPVTIDTKDPQKELIEPALKGTENVLNACLKNTNKLKRVVLTSSVAAITDEPIKLYTEEDWNDKSSLNRNPYFYSKVLAEKKAWEMVKENKPKWTLVATNPSLVLGPELHDRKSIGESNGIIAQLIQGLFPLKLNLQIGVVDIRDVSAAHIYLMENEKCKGRHILFNKSWNVGEVSDYLEELCKSNNVNSKLPTCSCEYNCCYGFFWCMVCCETPGIRDYTRTHLNKKLEFDSSKITSYGFKFEYDSRTSIKDTFLWALKQGIFDK